MPQDESKLLRDLRVICNGGATTYKCHATVMRAAYPALQDLAGDCLIVAEASPVIMEIIMEIAYYGRSEQELVKPCQRVLQLNVISLKNIY